MSDTHPPFSKSFVLKTTARHCRRSIDISIRKSFDRMADFQDDNAKKTEIFETLDVLHQFRKLIDDFQAHNPQVFSDEDNNNPGE